MWNKWNIPQDNAETQRSSFMQRILEAYLLDSEVQLSDAAIICKKNANILKINKKITLHQSFSVDIWSIPKEPNHAGQSDQK